jgi:hypothetical protein
MFGWQRRAVLGDDLETWFVRDKKDEAGEFLFWFGFAKPTVT